MARGAQMVPIDVDESGMRIEDLKRSEVSCKFVYVAPTYHDPTGAAMSLERRKQLLQWARQSNSLVVEDAFDSDYRYFGQPLPSLQSLDENGDVLYIYSMWKTLYPLSAVGVLVVPYRLISLFERVKLLAERQLPALEHLALTDFITEGHLERHMKRVRAVYTKRRQALIHALSLQFRSSVKIPKQSAALHLMLRLQSDLPTEQIMASARESNLPLVSTELYYVENPRSDEFLVAFASLDEGEIDGNVARWAKSLGYTGSD
jgi:GntR family transcriptional regulator/MocR family aminotransferase